MDQSQQIRIMCNQIDTIRITCQALHKKERDQGDTPRVQQLATIRSKADQLLYVVKRLTKINTHGENVNGTYADHYITVVDDMIFKFVSDAYAKLHQEFSAL